MKAYLSQPAGIIVVLVLAASICGIAWVFDSALEKKRRPGAREDRVNPPLRLSPRSEARTEMGASEIEEWLENGRAVRLGNGLIELTDYGIGLLNMTATAEFGRGHQLNEQGRARIELMLNGRSVGRRAMSSTAGVDLLGLESFVTKINFGVGTPTSLGSTATPSAMESGSASVIATGNVAQSGGSASESAATNSQPVSGTWTYLLQVRPQAGGWSTLRDPRTGSVAGLGLITAGKDELVEQGQRLLRQHGTKELSWRVVFFLGDRRSDKLLVNEAYGAVVRGSKVLQAL